MGRPRYFLGIEFAYARGKMTLSQQKYVLDLLEETGLLGCKLEITRPNISYAVGLLRQFMHEPREVHWQGVLRVLPYVKGVLGKGLLYKNHGHLDIASYSDSGYAGDRGDKKSTSGFCTYAGGIIVTWRSKKQNVVSKSSAET
ncbi:uncharacterized mitochondrial protein AtMg00810-like [Dioscorea cayenensis subsp. rotundata]|uniref:Uncharacterized mitochondrial protein AtMg00810-like n=1 Tax=Dioscorea cayennensis subsp. rotundata TaxID=55577 RepID=A0AB40C8T6_DIOCR|nr:uncharacterized mitochondrial protein AtMg00810-like [Dioscorea cayenensis subsp. rotundata]